MLPEPYDYDAELERHNTDKGDWNNTTLYYVYGQKILECMASQ
jgi:hypothetical protein